MVASESALETIARVLARAAIRHDRSEPEGPAEPDWTMEGKRVTTAYSVYHGPERENGTMPRVPQKIPQPPAQGITLQEAFNLHYCPAKESSVTGEHLVNIRTTLKRWGEWEDAIGRNHRITYPVVAGISPVVSASQITNMTVTAFLDWCSHSGESYGLVIRRFREVQLVLRSVVLGGRRAFQYELSPPAKPRQTVEDMRPARHLSAEALDALYQSCAVATWPEPEWKAQGPNDRRGQRSLTVVNKVPPPLWWRTVLSLWLITGLRCQDVVSYRKRFQGVLPTNFHLENTPCPWANTEITWKSGWLCLFAHKTSKYGKLTIVPLPHVVRAHLDAMLHWRSQGTDATGPVFVCPRTTGGPTEKDGQTVVRRGFYEQWRDILRAARKIRPTMPEDFMPQDFRRTSSGLWELARPGLGQHVLGHSKESKVHRHSYQNLIPILFDAVPRFTLPPAFIEGARTLSDQRTLF